MGNLLSMAKSVSRRIRRDAGRRRRHRRRDQTNSLAGRLRMAPIYYVYGRSCARRRLASVANPAFRDRERSASPMSNRRDFHNRPPLFRYVVLAALAIVYVPFYGRIDWKGYIEGEIRADTYRRMFDAFTRAFSLI